jgi:hypothetical protein
MDPSNRDLVLVAFAKHNIVPIKTSKEKARLTPSSITLGSKGLILSGGLRIAIGCVSDEISEADRQPSESGA